MKETANRSYFFLICLGLFLATAGVYCQVHGFEFVTLDDPGYVTENQHVVNGLNIKNFVWEALEETEKPQK